MNDELFVGLVKELKQARDAQERLTAAKKEMETELAVDPEYVSLTEKLKCANESVNSITTALKVRFADDPFYVPPFKAAWLVNATKVEIDDDKALEWAKVNMMAAVSEVIDKNMLTDFAKNNPSSAPYATVTKGKAVKIASDLSKFVDDAPVDQDVPF